MKQKDVDIVITTYNRPHELMKIIESLSKQVNTNFNLVINDDGGAKRIDPSVSPIITKYIYNVDDGYHRVARFNESVSLCVSPNIIIIDDDCIPANENFVQSHLNTLRQSDVCKGMVRFSNGLSASGWFSTANLGIKKYVIDDIGLFDEAYDGHYGHEDQDLGNRLKQTKYIINDGDDGSLVNHGDELYAGGDRSDKIIGHNTKYFIEKWGYDPR